MRTASLAFLLLVTCCGAPDRADGRRCSTGWALYCRSEGTETVFYLMENVGHRSCREVEAAPSVRGLDALDRMLATLAPGEVVTCASPAEMNAPERGFGVPMYTTDLGKALEARGRAHGVTVRTGSW
jgi:hypothetical protein